MERSDDVFGRPAQVAGRAPDVEREVATFGRASEWAPACGESGRGAVGDVFGWAPHTDQVGLNAQYVNYVSILNCIFWAGVIFISLLD